MPSSEFRALVVDDEPALRQLIALALGKQGVRCDQAENGQEALKYLERTSYDAVVSDLTMPVMDGRALATKVLSRDDRPLMVVVSGDLEPQQAEELLAGGVDNIAIKPIDFHGFALQVKVLLDRRLASTHLSLSEQLFTSNANAVINACELPGPKSDGFGELERQLSGFVDHCPAIAFLKDEAGRLLYANRRFEEACGTKNWRGKTDADLWTAETSRQLGENDAIVLATATAPKQFRETLESSTGPTQHWLTQRFTVSADNGRQLLGGMAVDVSQQRTAEEALRLSEEQLRQSVKMESLGQLAGGVAHDFNNLLTIILGYSDNLLQDESSRCADDEYAIREIQRAAQRAATLTRQLLAFSRKQVLEPKSINLNDTVSGILGMLERLIGEDIEVRTNLMPALDHVFADPVQIEQILINLAVNARDAMPNGGQLHLKTANIELGDNPQVYPGIEPGRFVSLTISDSGGGMTEATKARVFEPFFTTKAVGKGTGLGLATVYGIVKQSGGHIAIQSEIGHGTIVTIHLPSAKITGQSTPCCNLSVSSPQGDETILLVEDDENVRTVGRLALKSRGYTVLEASCPLEAIQICQSHPGEIHLLLTDVVMPKLNGRQLAEQLRASRPQMEVMYISGHSCEAMVSKGILAANVSFLQKPFTPASLAHKVRGTLLAAGLPQAQGVSI
jgi:signal transduction histidine kinase/DNA-binding response OmpR family regulator